MRILCAGDLHIGRRSSRVPAGFGDQGSASSAWKRLVDLALERNVHVVALSGDLVDQDNKFFEAVIPLRDGIRRLVDAGIHVVAVSGNHDHDVLPRIAAETDHDRFHFLGARGEWSAVDVNAGGSTARFMGWSFPSERVMRNPLETIGSLVTGDLPTIGLVHGDLDAPSSRYAPLALQELRARPERLWLLGHVHKPRLHHADGATVLYPGSPQALDPGETDDHGAWLVELAHGAIGRPEQVPLSTVWYGPMQVDVRAASDEQALESLLLQVVEERGTALVDAQPLLRHIVFRIELTGESVLAGRLSALAERVQAQLTPRVRDTSVAIDAVRDLARRPLDLESLAEQKDAIGALATVVRRLRDGDEKALPAALMRRLGIDERAIREARSYRSFEHTNDALPEAAMRATLERQASRMLDALVAQRGMA